MRIIAAGGGGFLMEQDVSPLDVHLARLPGVSKPRVCFIPTASGDLHMHIDKFYAAYEALGCEASHLALFRPASHHSLDLTRLHDQLLRQHLIFVGGGNTKSALAVWRDWGVDVAMRAAGEAGTILAGMSAGALCWFETGLTDSFGTSTHSPLKCLGFLPGACSVHYDADPNRRPSLHRAIQAHLLDAAYAIDDGAAMLFENGRTHRVIAWKDGARAYTVSRSGDGVEESPFDVEWIGG